MRGLAVVGALVVLGLTIGSASALPAASPVDDAGTMDPTELLPDMPPANGAGDAFGGGATAPTDPFGPGTDTPGVPGGDLLDGAALPAALAAGALGLVSFLAYGIVQGARLSTPEEVLRNEVRERIYGYLRANIGANLKQITDELALTTTNAIWHLRKLEDAGLIHSRRFNGYKVFYPAEGGVRARQLSLSLTALANENARSVFEYVVANPGTHQREIARALGVNHGTVRWHLKKLRRADILSEARQGKASVYFPTDVGLQALDNLEGGGANGRLNGTDATPA